MAIERLTGCIARAVCHTQFRNVYGMRLDSSAMSGLYAKKQKGLYCLSNTDAISVRETELTDLVSEITPMVARYVSPETGAVGNRFYKLMGSCVSPPQPSIEDYAKILILAAARIAPERVADLFAGWVEGRPIQVWLCVLLKGVITDGRLKLVDGLFLETLPRNGDEFPRSLYVQIDEHDIRHEQYTERAILSLEHNMGPALYSPNDETDRLPERSPPVICNSELSSVSIDSLCRAMSVETNNYVDWFMQWWDYGDVDAFFLNPGIASSRKDISGSLPKLVSKEQVLRCLEMYRLLEGYKKLDLCITRWIKSKRVATKEECLVELRIALESVLLADDKGVVGEKRHRLATRGAWLLGETFEKREAYFHTLRDVYDFASTVLHAGNLKEENTEKLANTINEAQALCRKAILRITKARSIPDWSDVILGKRFPPEP